jgi:hypothetical protein
MTTLDGLRAVRELLSDPARWTRFYFSHSGAFCLTGACYHVAPERTHAEVLGLLDQTIARLEGEG